MPLSVGENEHYNIVKKSCYGKEEQHYRDKRTA